MSSLSSEMISAFFISHNSKTISKEQIHSLTDENKLGASGTGFRQDSLHLKPVVPAQIRTRNSFMSPMTDDSVIGILSAVR